MTRNGNVDYTLLADYLAGRITLHDAPSLREWLATHPEEAQAVARGREGWHTVRVPEHPPLNVDALVQRVSTTIRHVAATPLPRRRGWRVAGMAGGAALAAALGLMLVPDIFVNGERGHNTPITRQYQTHTAQHATIDLPDGSRATLAPATSLEYIQHPNGKRTVTLLGQAFFRVEPDPAHPFSVQTGNVATRVLGTAFDVRKYATDSAVEVAVVSGKVSSAGRGDAVILTGGHIGVITDSSAAGMTGDVEAISGWMNGRLMFRNTPVPKVLETLGRWYGYEFKLADSTLTARHVSTTLFVTRQAETLLAIQELLDVTATKRGNIVTLTPRRLTTRNMRDVDSIIVNIREAGR